MGLLATVRAGVAIANSLTADLQAQVKHEAFVAETDKGDRLYDPAVYRPAIVVMKSHSYTTPEGELAVSNASVVFLDPAVEVSDDDRLTLPDGQTGPIVDRNGFVDRETGRPILTQVWLG